MCIKTAAIDTPLNIILPSHKRRVIVYQWCTIYSLVLYLKYTTYLKVWISGKEQYPNIQESQYPPDISTPEDLSPANFEEHITQNVRLLSINQGQKSDITGESEKPTWISGVLFWENFQSTALDGCYTSSLEVRPRHVPFPSQYVLLIYVHSFYLLSLYTLFSLWLKISLPM